MRYITMLKLSAQGRTRYPDAATLFTTCLDITAKVGGKVLETYAVSAVYDFVSISEYPTPEAAFEARLKLYELGIWETIEAFEAFEMDLFLSKV